MSLRSRPRPPHSPQRQPRRPGLRAGPRARREAEQGAAPGPEVPPHQPQRAPSARAPGPAHAPPALAPPPVRGRSGSLGAEARTVEPRARPPAPGHLGPGPPTAGPSGERAEGGGTRPGASGRLRPRRSLPPPWGHRVPCPCPAPPASPVPAAPPRHAPPLGLPAWPGSAGGWRGWPARKPRPGAPTSTPTPPLLQTSGPAPEPPAAARAGHTPEWRHPIGCPWAGGGAALGSSLLVARGRCTVGETEAGEAEGLPRSPDGRVRRRDGTPYAAGHRRASSPAHSEGLKSRRGWAPG